MKCSSHHFSRRIGMPAICFCAISALFAGCEENKLCTETADCESFCRSYSLTSIYYACEQNACICIDKDKLACTGAADETICSEICAKFAPNKTPACVDNLCDCLESSDENAEQSAEQTGDQNINPQSE